MESYLVGGAVRDSILGVQSKDYDFVVIAPSYEVMRSQILEEGFKIHVEHPEFYTLRAGVPQGHPLRAYAKDADFVWSRRDAPTSADGRHPDYVEPGTLEEDLARRDFTWNALAQVPSTGEIIDLFGGQDDLRRGVLRFVGNPRDRIMEDGLRVMRGFRFMITKDLSRIDPDTETALHSDLAVQMLGKVSVERIQIELEKMLRHDLEGTLHFLVKDIRPGMRRAIFRDELRLTTTMKDL